MTSRHLTWPRCYNARDLGGLPTIDGKETSWQAVIRSDIVNRLNEKGQQALLAYGVRTIIDLRSAAEIDQEPSIFAEGSNPSLTYVHAPLNQHKPHVDALLRQATTRSEEYCLLLDYYPDAVATVMDAIATTQTGGIVIHCHAGKDRTGLIAALLLRLVGVPVATVAADYAASEPALWSLYEKLVEEAGGEDKVAPWLKPTATEATMAVTLKYLDERYGGVASYLSAAALPAKTLVRRKQRLCPS